MANASLRWGRIVLGGFLAELLLIIAVIPVYATNAGQSVLTTVAVAGSFLAFIPVTWWLTRTTPRPLLHGTLMGAAGAALYIVLNVVGRQFDSSAPPTPGIYYLGHLLKLAGGAAGGWLASRASARSIHASLGS
jgi:hypothetical protein